MSTTQTEKLHTGPTTTTLSQLMRLLHEQGVTDALLNRHFTRGTLARVLKSDPGGVNLVALERALGLRAPFKEVTRPIVVDFATTISQMILEAGIITSDTRHEEIYFDHGVGKERFSTVYTHTRNQRYGNVQRVEEKRGVRSADLRELITFATMYDFGEFPLYALGTRLRNPHPQHHEVFWVEKNPLNHIQLHHTDSYLLFPPDARFLGIVIEE